MLPVFAEHQDLKMVLKGILTETQIHFWIAHVRQRMIVKDVMGMCRAQA